MSLLEPHVQELEITPPRQRATRFREATTAAILAAGRAELATHAPGELSLRAVARSVGMVPSALYRYFDSRQDLLAALTVDSYLGLGRAMDRRVEDLASASPAERALGVFSAARDWVSENPREFALMMSADNADGLGLTEPEGIAALADIAASPIRLYAEALAQGAIDETAVVHRGDFGLPSELIQRLVGVVPLDAEQFGVVCAGWTMIMGYLSLANGSPLAAIVAPSGPAYDEFARAVLRGMGYRDVPAE